QHRVGQWTRIPDAPHLDTEMVGFKIDRNPVRLKHRIEGIHNLLPQPFLDRKTPGKEPHEACELGNADDGLMREIADVGMPEKRQGMVLAQREKRDGSLDHLAQSTVRVTATLRVEHRE